MRWSTALRFAKFFGTSPDFWMNCDFLRRAGRCSFFENWEAVSYWRSDGDRNRLAALPLGVFARTYALHHATGKMEPSFARG